MKARDYYATLGVPHNATQDTIKLAYRKLARKYHPDVSREAYAELRFKEVGTAYKTLKDPEARLAYDQTLDIEYRQREVPPRAARSYGSNSREAPRENKRSEENFGEILNDIMGRPATQRRRRGINVHGSDQHAKVQIDLEESFHGTTCKVSMPTYVTDEYGMPMIAKRTLKVSVPKGIRGGQTLRLAGQGFPGTGEGKAGDLYLEVVIRPHRRYRVHGRDLYLDIPLTPGDAAFGTTIHVSTPAGSVQLSVPPGSTAGRKLRLKGKGIPGDPAGDLYAVIVNETEGVPTMVAKKALRAFRAAFDF